ncbi:hypothetical protein [Arenibaculum pallidiluteum]|uniref:hypothetical protein n=1 Tax=Arenibaculum pallidiluteum TaxID=2812559 RepID=UPI001A9616CC|nr:hypothetical protein [Arenibaculum pallidiluteum]
MNASDLDPSEPAYLGFLLLATPALAVPIGLAERAAEHWAWRTGICNVIASRLQELRRPEAQPGGQLRAWTA